MGHYVSVRGWIECDPESVDALIGAARAAAEAEAEIKPPDETIATYLRAWHAPKTHMWSAFIFFGIEMRAYYTDWIRDCIAGVAAADPDAEGWLRADSERASSWWRVEGGGVTVVEIDRETDGLIARTLPDGRSVVVDDDGG